MDKQMSLQETFKFLAHATAGLYLALFIVVGYVYFDSRSKRNELKAVATNTNNAFCAYRKNLKEDVSDSKRYLDEHPNYIIGVSTKTKEGQAIQNMIKARIIRQEDTIKTLSVLKCN
jgi:hypothetical protein